MQESENHLETEAKKELRKKKISEIEPIVEIGSINIISKADLAEIVDGPLLLACEDLFEKNVVTVQSSANKKNVGGQDSSGFISLDYDALSETNKKVADAIIKNGSATLRQPPSEIYTKTVWITIPLTEESTWGDVEDSSLELTSRFQKQRYMPKAYTPEYLMTKFAENINDDIKGKSVTPEYFEIHGYVFDHRSELFFLSQDDIDRAYKPIEGGEPDEPPEFSKVL